MGHSTEKPIRLIHYETFHNEAVPDVLRLKRFNTQNLTKTHANKYLTIVIK